MNPDPNGMENPTYRQVCSGSTGHVEVLEVELNDPEKHFEELCRYAVVAILYFPLGNENLI